VLHDPTVSILVDAQRTKGLELGLNGSITSGWSMAGGYAYQDGEITRSIHARRGLLSGGMRERCTAVVSAVSLPEKFLRVA
jgi:outer membrane receptor for monomeric catechols